MNQLEGFSQAQLKLDKGDLMSAKSAFGDFIEKWPESDLKPDAQFAEAFTMGAMGVTEDSRKLFEHFIMSNPKHPLIEDAKAMMLELR